MASRSVNKVLIIGNIARDAELNHTPSGHAVTKFSVATNRRYKQGEEWKDEVNFANVVLWGQEAVSQYLKKGKQVWVSGRLQTRSYDDKDGKRVYATDVIADEVILLGGGGAREDTATDASDAVSPYEKNQRDYARMTEQAKGAVSKGNGFGNLEITDADVPF